MDAVYKLKIAIQNLLVKIEMGTYGLGESDDFTFKSII